MNADRRLFTVEEALHLDHETNAANHREHLNPRLVNLLKIVNADQPFVRAEGPYLWDAEGVRWLDVLSGFAAANLGHNPPQVWAAVNRVSGLPNLVEGLGPIAGALAHNLAMLTPGNLTRAYFANSGAEVIDASIKLARAVTSRPRLVSCQKAFHGRTVGALSLMDKADYHDPFVPLLGHVTYIPFGDTDALEKALRGRNVAAFIVEPLQAEGGFISPPPGYLRHARDLCAHYGTLMVVDEIQTGMGRTGTMFALDTEDVIPDVLLLGKALGGAVMPLSALLTTDDLYFAAKGDTPRTPFHTSTYGSNTRACAAGMATIQAIIEEDLPRRAAEAGDYLIERLRELQSHQPMIADIRGRGLMIGLEVESLTHGLGTVLTGGMANRLSEEYLGILVLKELFTKHRIFTAYTANNPNVLRIQPPLNIEREDLDYLVDALDASLSAIRSFSRGALQSIPDLLRVRRA